MYVCPNCNARYDSETNFCTACGSKVELEQAEVSVKAPATGESAIMVLFGFLSNLALVFSGFFGMVAMATPYIYTSIRSGYYSYYASTSYSPNEACSVFCLLFALAAMGLGAVNFVFSLIKKAERKAVFANITKLVAGLLLFIFSIVLVANM